MRRTTAVTAMLLSLLAIPALAGCVQVLTRNGDDVLKIAFIPPESKRLAYQEQRAITLAFYDANDRRTLGTRRVALDDDVPEDIVVIAGARSADQDRLGLQLAFISVSPENSDSSLQPMWSLNCATRNRTLSCDDAAVKERERVFAARFQAFTGERPTVQAYIAYAEAESVVLAAQRLLVEGQLSYATLRRALLFGEFSTIIGELRYAAPPEMLD